MSFSTNDDDEAVLLDNKDGFAQSAVEVTASDQPTDTFPPDCVPPLEHDNEPPDRVRRVYNIVSYHSRFAAQAFLGLVFLRLFVFVCLRATRSTILSICVLF